MTANDKKLQALRKLIRESVQDKLSEFQEKGNEENIKKCDLLISLTEEEISAFEELKGCAEKIYKEKKYPDLKVILDSIDTKLEQKQSKLAKLQEHLVKLKSGE